MRKSVLGGFTLVEIMLASCILAIGLTPIFQAFGVSLNAFSRYARFVEVAPWIDEQMWDIRDQLLRNGSLSSGQTEGEVVIDHKKYLWTMSIVPVSVDTGLYSIALTLSWGNAEENGKHISRASYALALPKKKTGLSFVPAEAAEEIILE